MSGFVWGGNTGEKMTPQEVDRKRVAAALMAKQAGDTSPVASPFAGLNRALQGYISGRDDRRAGAAETAGMAQGRAAMDPVLAALSGGGQASGGGGNYVASPMTSQPMPAADTGMLGAQGGGSFGLPATDTGGMRGGMDMPPQKSGGLDFGGLEQQYGLPAGYLANVAQIESGGNPNAQNPNSSAGGMFQFIDSTAKQYGVADRFDPTQAANGAARLAADNAASLRKVLGREPTAGELYLAHQQGAGGASKLLSNPDALASAIVGSEAVRLNGGTDNMTAGQFANKWVSKVGGGQATAPTMGAPSGGNSDILGLLMQAQADPWAAQQYGPVLEALMGSELQTRQQQADPMYQLGLQKSQLELQQMQNPGSPKPIEINGQLVDPNTMQVLGDYRTAEAAPVAPRPMNDPQERAQWGIPASDTRPYAIEEGKPPQLIGGGGVTVNNDIGGGGKFEEAFAKGDADTVASVYNSGLSAQRNLGRIDQLEGLLSQSPTGMQGALAQAAGEWGINTEGLDAVQSAQAIINSLVPEQRQPGSGPMSDADLALFKQSLPRIINQPGGNETIVGTMRAIAQYDAEGASIVQRLRSGELTRPQAFEALQSRPNPLSKTQGAQAGSLNSNASQVSPQESPAPAGVDPEDWKFMSPEEKALFQ